MPRGGTGPELWEFQARAVRRDVEFGLAERHPGSDDPALIRHGRRWRDPSYCVAGASGGVFSALAMSALPKRIFTQQEYALLEERAEYKSQYVGGEIFAMAGTQPWHDKIVQNLSGMFYVRFRGRPCLTHSADMKVRAKVGDLWTYPDLSAVCGEPKYDTSASPHSLLNPQVLFEVLSPSTEAFDRGDKFIRYQSIESLSDYVLIVSERMSVEHFARQAAGGWLYREYHNPQDALKLESVGVELPLAEIYEAVAFPKAGNAG